MRPLVRYAALALALAALAWGVLALALGSLTLDLSSGSTAVSPPCLPATLGHTATLPGTGVDVSPEPGAGTANPHTQLSFLGVPAAAIRVLSVVGARSGVHAGHLEAYSQGDGGSFVPDAPFAQGERVSVRVALGARQVAYAFRVDTPYSTAHVPEFPAPPASPADDQSFYTLPHVFAPVLNVTVPDRDPAAGDILTTNGPGPGQFGPLIYTPQGRLVWFEHLPPGITAEDLNEQTYAGQRDLTWSRACHSQRTRPVRMSISCTATSTIAPDAAPPACVRLQRIGLYAVMYATSWGTSWKSCRSARRPLPPPILAIVW